MKNRIAKYDVRNRISHLFEHGKPYDEMRVVQGEQLKVVWTWIDGTIEITGESDGKFFGVALVAGSYSAAWVYSVDDHTDFCSMIARLGSDHACQLNYYQASYVTKMARGLL